MKLKIAIISAISIPLLISILQILPVPPYAGNLFPVFRSGYFVELDRQFEVIRDAFLGIKMMSRPVYAWIFLDDIEKKHAIKITVHNARGEVGESPGGADTGSGSSGARHCELRQSPSPGGSARRAIPSVHAGDF